MILMDLFIYIYIFIFCDFNEFPNRGNFLLESFEVTKRDKPVNQVPLAREKERERERERLNQKNFNFSQFFYDYFFVLFSPPFIKSNEC